MKKKVLIAGLGFIVILAGAGVGGYQWLLGRFDKASVVSQMEAAWNCRAQIDATDIQMLASPARLQIKGLQLAPKDDQMGLPLAQRQPLAAGKALLATESAVLEVELKDLINGTVNVKELHISGVSMRTEVDEEGRSSLQTLFKSPEAAPTASQASDQAVQAQVSETKATGVNVTEVKAETEVKKAPESKSAFRASDMKVAVQVNEASLERGSMEILNQKSSSKIQLQNLNLVLKAIDVNPADLAAHNHCGFELAGAITFENLEKRLKLADINLQSKGSLEPFDVKTGEWMPDLNLEVTVAKGGLLGGMLMTDQLRKKDKEKLEEYGLNLDGISLGGVLQEDAFIKVHQIRGKVIMKGDVRFVFPQYEIQLVDGSWVNASQDLHNVKGRLVLNADLTTKKLEEIRKSLADKFGADLTDTLFPTLAGTLLDSEKRLSLPFKSKGSLAKPDVGFDNIFADVKDLLKDSAAGFLKGLLKK